MEHHRNKINPQFYALHYITTFVVTVQILLVVFSDAINNIRCGYRPIFDFSLPDYDWPQLPSFRRSYHHQPQQQPVQQQPVVQKVFDWEKFAAGINPKSLYDRVIGQDFAIDEVVLQLRIGATKRLHGSKKPVSVMLLVGPSGVGKTETAKAITKVYPDLPLITFDMSEFYDKHTASRLIGSPPGYIGSDRGGQLTSATRKNTGGCVILFDEVEKADMSVHTMFLQLFDEGRLTDASTGEAADFGNSLILLTSNLCQEEIRNVIARDGDGITPDKRLEIMNILRRGDMSGKRLPPELLGRINAVIPYGPLSDESKIKIVSNWLKRSPLRDHFSLDDILENVNIFKISETYGVRGMINEVERYCYQNLPRGVKI
jgi:ATP-dependent Clp protease ATP-binding subunit ClpB